ncbi:MAG TPA: NAD(P)-binding domain-containing protein [Ktedonosporobacter sp.]|nr:NAD(P)-binding domain-containing protein [Ktedonosporobacter sp.]
MKHADATVVIGAGPYGLSVAAHLKARGRPLLVLGKPMEFWQNMPARLCLKSVWSASSFSDPAGRYSLNRYVIATNTFRQEPIPLPFFLDYGSWFQQQAAPDIDPTYVQSLKRDGKDFHLDLADGRVIEARRVIVAVGISAFAFVPDFAHNLPGEVVSHTQTHKDFTQFGGSRVAVVGSGQSGLESAALLHEAGADVELITRGPVIWIDRRLYRYTGPARYLFYPPSDVGPPGINWLTALPQIYSLLPSNTRQSVAKRAVRPAGAEWLRSRVEKRIKITSSTSIVSAKMQGQRVVLHLSNGTTREVDHLFLGTGYQPDIRKVALIDLALREQIQESNGYPVLNKWFESSVPRLHFVGALAGYTFGPICRFVAGAKVPAQYITQQAMRDQFS